MFVISIYLLLLVVLINATIINVDTRTHCTCLKNKNTCEKKNFSSSSTTTLKTELVYLKKSSSFSSRSTRGFLLSCRLTFSLAKENEKLKSDASMEMNSDRREKNNKKCACFLLLLRSIRMDCFFHRLVFRTLFFLEEKFSEFFALVTLIHMIMINRESISLNNHTSDNEQINQQLSLNQLHDLANQTERELQTAIQSNIQRNEQLNVLLDRSDLLMHKNQAFGLGVIDYRKDFERKQSINKLKYIAIGILLLLIVVLVVILNLVLNHTNHLSDRNTNIILE